LGRPLDRADVNDVFDVSSAIFKMSAAEINALLKKIFNVADEAERMKIAATPALLESYIESAKREARLAGVSFDEGFYNKLGTEWLEEEKGTDYWESDSAPNAFTQKQIHSRLAEGIAKGESVGELAERIDGLFEQTYKGRALTIAHTEAASAYGEGAQELRTQEKMENKEWIAASDSLTRDSHADADGQVVKNDKPFSVGGYSLMYPGDPSGGPEEICNCRCSSAAVVSEKAITSYMSEA